MCLISSTFGVKTLMSSLRKRNLAASLWNRLPQLFIQASRIWKTPKKQQEKKLNLTTRNWRTFTQHSTERRDFHLWYLWLTTFKMSHVLRHMVLKKLLQVASHSETLATSCACPHSSFKLGLNASCRFVHVINISHGYYSPHTQSYNKHICFSVNGLCRQKYCDKGRVWPLRRRNKSIQNYSTCPC